MAIYHCNVSNIGKSAGSAQAKFQYALREGKYSFQKSEESDLVYGHSGNMPAWAREDAEAYWRAADTFSRGNAQLCKQVEIALPQELSREQQIKLALGYAERISHDERGNHPYTFGIHDSGNGNPHAHMYFSSSMNDGNDRTPEQWFKNRSRGEAPPEQGGAPKAEEFHNKEFIPVARLAWEEEANRALALAGFETRISRLSLEAQGIEREPQIHVGYHDPARPEIHAERSTRNQEIVAGNIRHSLEADQLVRAERELASLNRELESLQAKQKLNFTPQEVQQRLEENLGALKADAGDNKWSETAYQSHQLERERLKQGTAFEKIDPNIVEARIKEFANDIKSQKEIYKNTEVFCFVEEARSDFKGNVSNLTDEQREQTKLDRRIERMADRVITRCFDATFGSDAATIVRKLIECRREAQRDKREENYSPEFKEKLKYVRSIANRNRLLYNTSLRMVAIVSPEYAAIIHNTVAVFKAVYKLTVSDEQQRPERKLSKPVSQDVNTSPEAPAKRIELQAKPEIQQAPSLREPSAAAVNRTEERFKQAAVRESLGERESALEYAVSKADTYVKADAAWKQGREQVNKLSGVDQRFARAELKDLTMLRDMALNDWKGASKNVAEKYGEKVLRGAVKVALGPVATIALEAVELGVKLVKNLDCAKQRLRWD